MRLIKILFLMCLFTKFKNMHNLVNNMKSKIFFIILIIVLGLIFFVNDTSEEIPALNLSIETDDDPYADLRNNMVDKQLITRDITDKKVLEVMRKVPRHEFIPSQSLSVAYEDHPVPIGHGQTISQPYIVALMTQSLELKPDDKVLEIGTGSGYQAAVLAEIVKEVYTIEIVEALANSADQLLKNMDYNINVKYADGYYGWEEHAPFDAIIVTSAANHIPPPLIEQLKDGGKLIIPLGPTIRFQTLTIITKKGEDLDTRFITGVRFVPMTGKAQE